MDIKLKIVLDILKHVDQIKNLIKKLGVGEKISIINEINESLREVNPLKGHPLSCVIWKNIDEVIVEKNNSNMMAPTEYKLLKKSIYRNGYTQPIIASKRVNGGYSVIDGKYRFEVGKLKYIRFKTKGYVPIVLIRNVEIKEDKKIAVSLRHNRSRGVQDINLVSEKIIYLLKNGWTDKKIIEELGVDKEELYRLKQVSGLLSLFKNESFSKAWESKNKKSDLGRNNR